MITPATISQLLAGIERAQTAIRRQQALDAALERLSAMPGDDLQARLLRLFADMQAAADSETNSETERGAIGEG